MLCAWTAAFCPHTSLLHVSLSTDANAVLPDASMLECAVAEPLLVQGHHKRALLLEGQCLLEQQGPILGQAGCSRDPAIQEQSLLDAVYAVPLFHMIAVSLHYSTDVKRGC